MKKILFLLLIISASCKSTKIVETTKSKTNLFKNLQIKYSFPNKLRDTTIINTKTIVYENGLIQNYNLKTGCFNYKFNKKEIIKGNINEFWYPIVMYDKFYFTASKIVNTKFGPASI